MDVGKNKEKEETYGNSPKKPAVSCFKIREKQPLKKNGYFWVKMPCMPESARVYCDFEDNFPNFYLYKGYPRNLKKELEDADSPDGIRRHCGQLGLEPVEIKSETIFETILDYLDESGSSSEDGYGIPIAYKYENGPLAPFRSFNHRESPSSYDSFKNFIKQKIVTSIGQITDAYVLKD